MHVLSVHRDPSVLFNCQYESAEPDWRIYQSLVVAPCKNDLPAGAASTWIVQCGASEAEFWTVYGRYHDGECDAITDCESKADADWIVAEFIKRSNLPLEV